jgi:hypothetical protein
MPDVEALRHLLHHRSELINTTAWTSSAADGRRTSRASRLFVAFVAVRPRKSAPSQTSRQDFTANTDRRMIDHAG